MSNPKLKHKFYKSELFKKNAHALDAWPEIDELKEFLDSDPKFGKVIPNGNGLRKVRMGLPGRGKSGGARVIYYCQVDDYILLLHIYAKNEKEDLKPKELNGLVGMCDSYRVLLK